MLGAYLRHTVMVAAALMTIALTIDLWPQVPLFSGNPLHVMWSIVRLAALAAFRSFAALHSLRHLPGRGVERERLHRIA